MGNQLPHKIQGAIYRKTPASDLPAGVLSECYKRDTLLFSFLLKFLSRISIFANTSFTKAVLETDTLQMMFPFYSSILL